MKIYFSGIGGSGVSAIAGFMADKKHLIAGSDRLFDFYPDHPVRKRLEANGVIVFPQDGQGIDGSYDLAVFSTSVEKNNPDYRMADTLGLPVKTRPEYLAELVSDYKTIAVAGTSGKSTTAGMLAFLMQRLGMAPNFIGGGRVKQFKTLRNPGNFFADGSDILVIEACESDGTIVNYRPFYSIILNLALDHHSIAQTAGMFEQLSDNTSQFTIVCADDKNLAKCAIKNARFFSIHRKSEYHAKDIVTFQFKTIFKVNGQEYELSMPGEYNLYNALGCIALLSELGVPAKDIAASLPSFSGIERRFDVHRNDGRYLIIDDYAHNPHKIQNLMAQVKKFTDKVCYIFQPHGYGPTRLMKNGYIETFTKELRMTDRLVLLPIYYAGGATARDISSEDILRGVKAAGKSVEVITERMQFFDKAREEDTYVIFGARDDTLSDFAKQLAEILR